jgi:hypothetical protein
MHVRPIPWAGVLLLAEISLAPRAWTQPVFRESTQAPFAITAGLGVSGLTAPELFDYMNAFAQPMPEERIDEFSSAAEYFIMPEARVGGSWSVALEYSFLPKRHRFRGGGGISDSEFTYDVHMPTAIVHHLVSGTGYHFKFGGGVGYYFARFEQFVHAYGASERFTTEGLGMKLQAVGDTQFDEMFYGSIGVDLRWGFLGEFRNTQGAAHERASSKTARMQFFTVGLKFGVMVQF